MAPSRGDGASCWPESHRPFCAGTSVVTAALAADLAAENSRLVAELAAAERKFRQSLSEADRRRTKLEDEVSYLKGLVLGLFDGEPAAPQVVARRVPEGAEKEGMMMEAETQRLLRASASLCQVAKQEVARTADGRPQAEESEHLIVENDRLASEGARLAAECERLSQELALAESGRERLAEAEARARAELEQSWKELGERAEECAQREAESRRLREDAERLDAESRDVVAERERLLGELKSAQLESERARASDAGMRAELDLQAERLVKASEESALLKEDSGRLQGENEQLREDIGLLLFDNEQLREDSGRLQGENEQLREDIGLLQEEIEHLREGIGLLQGENEQLREDSGRLPGESEQLREDVGRLQGENEQLQAACLTAAQDHDRLFKVSRRLESEKQSAVAEHERLAAELARAKSEGEELASSEAQARADLENQLERLAEASQECAGLATENGALKDENGAFKDDKERLLAENQRLLEEHDRLAAELAGSEAERRLLAAAAETRAHVEPRGGGGAGEAPLDRSWEAATIPVPSQNVSTCSTLPVWAAGEAQAPLGRRRSFPSLPAGHASVASTVTSSTVVASQAKCGGRRRSLPSLLGHGWASFAAFAPGLQRQSPIMEVDASSASADFAAAGAPSQEPSAALEDDVAPLNLAAAPGPPQLSPAPSGSGSSSLSGICQPSVPSTTSSLPQLLSAAVASGPLALGSAPTLPGTPPVLCGAEGHEAEAVAGQTSAASRLAPSQQALGTPAVVEMLQGRLRPGSGAPPLRPPVPVHPPTASPPGATAAPVPPAPAPAPPPSAAAAPSEEDRALAAEAASRFVASLLGTSSPKAAAQAPVKEEADTAAVAVARDLAAAATSAAVAAAAASAPAPPPAAADLSADVGRQGPSIRTSSDAKLAEPLSDEDQLLASRPTIPVSPAGEHADVSVIDSLEASNPRRRRSFQPPKRFQMKRSDTFTIGELDEDSEGALDFATRHMSLPSNAAELGRARRARRGQPRSLGAPSLEALVLGERPRQPSDASGWPLPARLQALRELPQEREVSSERPLVEGLFVLALDKLGSPCVRFRWLPQDGLGYESLEDAVVRSGFCPDPVTFAGGEPFVFSLLETALDPRGNPGGTLYGCVCGDAAAPEPGSPELRRSGTCTSQASKAKALLQRAMTYPTKMPSAAKEGTDRGTSWSLIPGSVPSAEEACAVYCLVSRLPLFAFHFEVLEIIRGNLSAAPELLARINSTGLCENLVSEGLELGGFAHLTQGSRLRLRPPRPLLCDWWSLCMGSDVSPWSPVSRTLARWQVAWALGTMMTHWDNLVGDTLVRLLACVLLEQKVLLLGDAPRSSAAALALRGLLWPFRWLHLFLSAPPPPELLDMPLLDGTFPLVICLSELPRKWGFRTPYELPPEVVAGILRHDYVHISQHLETAGGLKGRALKLPEGRHALLLKQIAHAKQKLRKGEVDVQGAAELIQEVVEAEVWRLAKLVREYAAVQVEEARKVQPPIALAGREASLKGLQERCSGRAMRPEVFVAWLRRARPESCTDEALPFYQSFFGTQLCHDLLCEELLAQVRTESASDLQG